MAKIFAMTIKSCCDCVLIWWLLFVIGGFSQFPELSLIARPQSFGRCVSLVSSMLGDFHYPSSLGLVPYSLLANTRRNKSSIYYTNELPSVRILRSVRTCQSRDTLKSHYNTASFLVSYTCKGIACEQPPDSVQSLNYVHLFSFVCQKNNQYTSWNFVPGYEVHINRNTTNSILHPVTTPSGSCVLCTNDPAFKGNPRFDSETGCISCKPECLSVGFGQCITSIGDDAKQTCCSYWYQPVAAKSRMCVQNFPPPYINSSTGDCIKTTSHEEMNSSLLNFCNGGTISFKCSTLFSVHNLTWQITYPCQDPVNITYNVETSLEADIYSAMGISSTFSRNSLQIESVITLDVSNENSIDGTEVKCSMSRLEPAVIHIQYDSLNKAPSAPAHFVATEEYLSHSRDKSIGLLTLQWDPAQTSPQSITQWYELEIYPQTLSPVVLIASSPMNLTLQFGVEYVATLRAVNCVGSSSPVSILIQLDKSPGPMAYISSDIASDNHVIAEHENTALDFSCSSYSSQPTNLTWKVETNSGMLPIDAAQVYHSKQCQKLMWKRPALFRDSGVYSCTASNRNGAKTAKLKVNVEGLATIVSISPSKPLFFSSSSSIKVPENYAATVLTCAGTSWPPPVAVKWVNNTMHTLSSSTRILNMRFISVELRFERGFMVTDVGVYACVVEGNGTQLHAVMLEHSETTETAESIECELDSRMFYFQIRVLGTPCSFWDASMLRVTEANLMDAVSISITSQCSDCNAEIVITNQTACSTVVNGAALFRGRITSSPAETKRLLCELRKWQRTGPIIHLSNDRTVFFQVDRTCDVKLKLLNDSECSMESSPLNPLVYSVGSAVAGIMLIIAVVIGILCYRRKKKSGRRHRGRSRQHKRRKSSRGSTLSRPRVSIRTEHLDEIENDYDDDREQGANEQRHGEADNSGASEYRRESEFTERDRAIYYDEDEDDYEDADYESVHRGVRNNRAGRRGSARGRGQTDKRKSDAHLGKGETGKKKERLRSASECRFTQRRNRSQGTGRKASMSARLSSASESRLTQQLQGRNLRNARQGRSRRGSTQRYEEPDNGAGYGELDDWDAHPSSGYQQHGASERSYNQEELGDEYLGPEGNYNDYYDKENYQEEDYGQHY